jgi:hypothetical protein
MGQAFGSARARDEEVDGALTRMSFANSATVPSLTRTLPSASVITTISRWSGVWLHTLVVSVVAVTSYLYEPYIVLIVGGLLIIPTYIFLGLSEASRTPLFFNPLSFYFLWYSINFGMAALYVASLIEGGRSVGFSVAMVSPGYIGTAYVVSLCGSLALHVGIRSLRPLESEGQKVSSPRGHEALSGLMVMTAIGVAMLLKPEWFAVFGNVIHALQSAPMAALIIFGLLGRRYFRLSQGVFTVIFAAGTALLFFVNLRSSSKAFLMFSFLPLLWMLLARRDMRRWLPAAIVPLALLYFLIIAPTVNRARGETLARGETKSGHLLTAFSNIDLSTVSPTDTENIGKQLELFLGRQFDPIAAAYLVGKVERLGYQMGATMQYAAYAFIPRVLWPEKPSVSKGDWFNKYVGAAPGTSLGITAVGELYWNFGVPGVVIGMFVVGCGFGILWRMAGTNPLAQPLHMLLYVIITITGMTDMPQAISVLVAQVSYGLIFGTVFALFERQSMVSSAKIGVRTV